VFGFFRLALKTNTRRLISAVILGTTLICAEKLVLAQGRPIARPVSLTKLRACQSVRGPRWFSVSRSNNEIPIELRLYRAVAGIVTNGTQLYSNVPAQIICKLAEPGEAPRFRTLNLSLGHSDRDKRQGGTIRVSVYSNGNFIDSRTINFGPPLIWTVNITGTEDLALKFECVEPSRALWNPNEYLRQSGGQTYCATTLFFFDDTLR
jgi:hypothetical protein